MLLLRERRLPNIGNRRVSFVVEKPRGNTLDGTKGVRTLRASFTAECGLAKAALQKRDGHKVMKIHAIEGILAGRNVDEERGMGFFSLCSMSCSQEATGVVENKRASYQEL